MWRNKQQRNESQFIRSPPKKQKQNQSKNRRMIRSGFFFYSSLTSPNILVASSPEPWYCCIVFYKNSWISPPFCLANASPANQHIIHLLYCLGGPASCKLFIKPALAENWKQDWSGKRERWVFAHIRVTNNAHRCEFDAKTWMTGVSGRRFQQNNVKQKQHYKME